MQSRRTFLRGSVGFGATLATQIPTVAAAVPKGRVRMSFGLLADVHITNERQIPYFEKALRKFDAWKADAVLACGDLADYGLKQQLKLVADTWFRVFPGNRGSDGRPVANLLHYGDHDMATWYVDKPEAKKLCPDDAERKASLIFTGDNRGRFWEECFHEPWHPIELKTVKGIPFILSHFTRGEKANQDGNNVPGLEAFMRAHAFDPNRPVFYSQHRVPRGTACGPYAWGQDDGTTTKIFSHYPNLIALCGHLHNAGNCELNVWQGAFTSIHVPSLRYAVTLAGRENGYSLNDRPPRPPVQTMPSFPSHANDIHQGFFCQVYDDALVVRRWEFTHDAAIGPDWVIPFSSFRAAPEQRPFAFANRARTLSVPVFAADAKVTFKRTKAKNRLGEWRDMVAVSFPPAVPTADGLRADDYEVTLEMNDYGIRKILSQHRVYSPRYTHPVKLDTAPVVCLIDAAEFPTDRRELWLSVRPVNAFEAKGTPITVKFEDQKRVKA